METSYIQNLVAITTTFILFSIISIHLHKKNQPKVMMPINWLIVGMLPHLIFHLHRLHDYLLEILPYFNGTLHFKGPWFTSMEVIATTDPLNVHHVMSKNFSNFPKGEEFYRIFDILGDGFINSDFELWRYQRKVAHSFLTHSCFHRFLVQTVNDKVEKGLIPILDCGYESGDVMNIEDLLQRFTFDTICTLLMGNDPNMLSLSLPDIPFCKALDEAEEALLLRHVMPEVVWKIQKWLNIGSERRLSRAWKVFDEFIYHSLAIKRQKLKRKLIDFRDREDHQGQDLLTLCMQDNDDNQDHLRFGDKFLRDMFLSFIIAGRDTTSSALTWFFWLLHKNPNVESKIRQEIKLVSNEQCVFKAEQVSKLVYLHGALCETLRLYPSVPFQHRSPLEPDMLPSGHRVTKSIKIIFCLYAMGRSESIWGEDCLEFKPERWITKKGKIKHEPSYKYLAFNAGPRSCLGKDMAFLQMKIVAASVLTNGYRLQVIDEEKVEPAISMILHTKHGLKVKVVKVTC